MVDHISNEYRSWNMSRIKSVNTTPEKIVRSALFKAGLRFRLNGKVSIKYHPNGKLPGKPDIILAKYSTVLFVHGCFWHHHYGCKRANWPKSNKEYWIPKIKKNMIRDKENINRLRKIGWNVEIIWECETKKKNFKQIINKLIKKIVNGLNQ
jgi:DNA mismatch endonuclease (patch repair protein)